MIITRNRRPEVVMNHPQVLLSELYTHEISNLLSQAIIQILRFQRVDINRLRTITFNIPKNVREEVDLDFFWISGQKSQTKINVWRPKRNLELLPLGTIIESIKACIAQQGKQN